MNRTDFYKSFAKEYGISQAKAKEHCYAMFEHLSKCIRENERVYIKGLGTFKRRTIAAKRIGNIRGGEPIMLPETERIVFEITEVDDSDNDEE